ncbi:unnamed protein product [Prorocentrum cordatum]|uniref:Uncharacterized protein n=1 Tax=Prorocentrum cordatum TaxID=2364126 RepID=A0ABN9PY93_9DINO|nr:unnamed protein product [Polarella glacialis]
MDDALLCRVQALVAAEPSLGYRGLHAKLKSEPEFQQVSLKKVQTVLQALRREEEAAAAAPPVRRAAPGENLWTAASDGDIARVEELMALEGFTPSSPDENGYTPVHAAASWGHPELLRLLLSRGSEAANVRDEDGDTPLHHVAGNNDLAAESQRAVIDLLLEHRADPTLQNSEGKTCLDACGQDVVAMDDEEATEPPNEEVCINVDFIKIMAERGYEHQ